MQSKLASDRHQPHGEAPAYRVPQARAGEMIDAGIGRQQLAAAFTEPASLPDIGLELRPQLPYETWKRIGSHLARVADSSAWCLGDWLVYGISNYPNRYRTAIELTSLSYKTLRNYAWVATAIPISRRRKVLSFGHHAEVAPLSDAEQNYWLRKAEELRWSRNFLRQQIQTSLAERSLGRESAAAASDDPEVRLVLTITRRQQDVFESAAAAAGVPLAAWITAVLEGAVRIG